MHFCIGIASNFVIILELLIKFLTWIFQSDLLQGVLNSYIDKYVFQVYYSNNY